MKCPECDFDCPDNAVECPACGLIFDRWKEHSEASPVSEPVSDETPVDEDEVPNAVDVPESEPIPVEAPVAEKQTTPRKILKPVWAFIGLAVILLAVGLYFVFGSKPSKPASVIVISVPSTNSAAVVSPTPNASTTTVPVAVVPIAKAATPNTVPQQVAKPTAVPKVETAPAPAKVKAENPTEKKPTSETTSPAPKTEEPVAKKSAPEAGSKPAEAAPKVAPTAVPAGDDNSALFD
jgi:hypothetical protein